MSGLAVVYEDERLIAVSKAAGQAVIPGRGLEAEPLAQQVGRCLGAKAFVVHRIDRDSSGLVVFAKDAATHRILCGLFEGRLMRKLYLVLAQGRMDSDGVVERPLRLFGSGRMGVWDCGKPSRTEFRVKACSQDATLLEVEPKTGRRHQIRVHLHSLGHPVMGDRLYGEKRPVGGLERLMLHAWRLEFALKGEFYRLCAPPTDDFLRILNAKIAFSML